MGVVWAAVNEQTLREVAVKLILSADDHLRQRLIREARACGQLSHRNIIEVLDAGQTDAGDPYLVMPLLVGETLEDLLERRHKLEPPLVAQIGRDVARALTAAHAASIVHRDLKPANIFLHREAGTEGVVVKVVDFGICKRLEAQDTNLTTAGKVVGSPSYMSPEQLNPENGIDHRTDIWSLGVVIFEMLAGVRPFQGERVKVILSIMDADVEIPSLSQLVRFVPPGLADIVSSCLMRDRSQRIGTAEELANRLHTFASAGDVVRVYGPPIERASDPPHTGITRERVAKRANPKSSEASRESVGSLPGNTLHVDPETDLSELPTVPLMGEHLGHPALRQPPALPPSRMVLPACPRSAHRSTSFEPMHSNAALDGVRALSSGAPQAPSPSEAAITAPISIHHLTPAGFHSRAIASGNGAAPTSAHRETPPPSSAPAALGVNTAQLVPASRGRHAREEKTDPCMLPAREEIPPSARVPPVMAPWTGTPPARSHEPLPDALKQRDRQFQPKMTTLLGASVGTAVLVFIGVFLLSARAPSTIAVPSHFPVPPRIAPSASELRRVEPEPMPTEDTDDIRRSRKRAEIRAAGPAARKKMRPTTSSTSPLPQPIERPSRSPVTPPRRCKFLKC